MKVLLQPRRKVHGPGLGKSIPTSACLFVSLLLALEAPAAPAAAQSEPGSGTGVTLLDKVPWSRIEYRAKKLFMTAEASIEVEKRPADILIELESHFLNRDWQARLLTDPLSGATRLFERYDSRGDNTSSKRIRFEACRTVSLRKDGRPPALAGDPGAEAFWAGAAEQVERFPEAQCPKSETPWTMDSAALLFAIATADYEGHPKGPYRWPVLIDGAPMAVVAERVGLEGLDVDYTRRSPDGIDGQVNGMATVLHLQLRGEPWSGGSGTQGAQKKPVEVELLGLSGDVLDIYIDLQSRLPLEVRGRLPSLGTIRVRARNVWMGSR